MEQIVGDEASSFGGDTYSPKLSMLLLIIPLCLPPAIAVRIWFKRRHAALFAAS